MCGVPILINDTQTSPQKLPNWVFVSKSCTIFWNLWRNNFSIFIFWDMVDVKKVRTCFHYVESSIQKTTRGAAPVGGAGRAKPHAHIKKIDEKKMSTFFFEKFSNIFSSNFFFSSDFNEKIFCYESDDFRKKKNLKLKKKKFDEKMFENFPKKNAVKIFFSSIFFYMGVGLRPPRTPHRGCTPARILDWGLYIVETGSHSTAFQQKIYDIWHFFHQHFFLSTFKFFFLKIVWIVPKKIFIEIRRKKKIWPHFSLFSGFKSTISQN